MTLEDFAVILWDTCRAHFASIYEWKEREWEKLFDYERADIIAEVKFFMDNPNIPVEVWHNKHIKEMVMKGWSVGKQGWDLAAKKDPNLCNFHDLKPEYKFRHYLFKAAVDILLNKMGNELEDYGENDEKE